MTTAASRCARCQRVNNNVTCASDWLPGCLAAASQREPAAKSANTNVPFQHELGMCSLSWTTCMRVLAVRR